ncbi:MAG: pimeloyl-ACP methyl ester carboxylesterase, partial [Candidatus Azotimanducaceae bacterium]
RISRQNCSRLEGLVSFFKIIERQSEPRQVLNAPLQDCTEHYTQVGDINLCWFEWGKAYAEQGTTLLVHATGFHARCWDQTIRHLPSRHIIAVEMRGHGRSDNTGPITWEQLSTDLAGFVEALGLHDLVAAGHSLGGYCLTHAAALMPERFRRLVLIDPVIMDPEFYNTNTNQQANFLDEKGRHPVAKRRNQFDSVAAMVANFTGRGSFAVWQDAVLQDYCEYGLLPSTAGEGFVLACPPTVEAAIYMGSGSHDLYGELDRVVMPVTVLRAFRQDGPRTEMNFSLSPTYPGLAALFPDAEDIYLPELTHFMPMQAPKVVAQYLLKQ